MKWLNRALLKRYVRHVGRLRRSRPQTPPVRLLLNPPPDPKFDDKVTDICETYLSATARVLRGERTVSLDEMTGIQALSVKHRPSMRPGKTQRREFEYIRHGTQTLIASFDAASGQVVQGLGRTRTEADMRLCATTAGN